MSSEEELHDTTQHLLSNKIKSAFVSSGEEHYRSSNYHIHVGRLAKKICKICTTPFLGNKCLPGLMDET